MNDNYIDQFGERKDYKSSGDSKHYFVPLNMGILSFVLFVIYLCSAFGSRSVLMCVVYFVPILSIIGLVFSYITRDARREYNLIWLSGLISCLVGLIVFFFLFIGTMAALAQD